MKKTVIVAPYGARRLILKELRRDDPFREIKFYTRESLIAARYGSCGDEAVVYLIRTRHLSYSRAVSLLASLIFVEKMTPELCIKAQELYAIRLELMKRGLLIVDEYLAYELAHASIIVRYYPKEDVVLQKILAPYDVVYERPTYEPDADPIFRLVCCCFSDAEDEVVYMMNRISELIDDGVSPEKIFLKAPPGAYLAILPRVAKSYGLNLNGLQRKSLAVCSAGRAFLADYLTRDEKELPPECQNDEPSSLEVRRLIDLYRIEGLTKDEQYHVYREMLLTKRCPLKRFKEALSVITDPIVGEDEYLFVLGFHENIFPVAHKDEDYLFDREKKGTAMPTSLAVNLALNVQYEDYLRQPGTIVLSCSHYLLQETCRPNYFLEKLKIECQDEPQIDVLYSFREGMLRMAHEFDVYEKYKPEDNDQLARYAELLGQYPHKAYSCRYKGVDHFDQDSHLILSASHLETYTLCPYAYYLLHVLHVDPPLDNFYIRLGKLTHRVMEHLGEADFETLFEKAFAEWPDPTPRDRGLLRRIKDELEATCVFTLEHEKELAKSGPKPMIARELNVEYALDEKTRITGRIDKLIIAGPRHDQLIIVDYKTGGTHFVEAAVPFGLSMQLPVYALLLKNDPRFQDLAILGIYNARLIQKNRLYDRSDPKMLDYDRKLDGVTIAEEEKAFIIEPFLKEGARFVKGLRLDKQGLLWANPHVRPADWFLKMAMEALGALKLTARRIRDNDFRIAPIIHEKKPAADACRYCPFKDICHIDAVDRFILEAECEEEMKRRQEEKHALDA